MDGFGSKAHTTPDDKIKEEQTVKRQLRKEWLDEEEALSQEELEASLLEVWAVNRWLGGNPPLFRHLSRLLADSRGSAAPVRVLDVATGMADQPLALCRWAEKRGIPLEVTGVEISPSIAKLARKRIGAHASITIHEGDGRKLPYGDGAFDIAFSNLALHHMSDEDAVAMLREMDRVTRTGWIVTDLERSRTAYGIARLLAKLVWRSPVTRHDGPLSVQRSFTAAEARRLLAAAGLEATVKRHFPYRLALLSRV